MSDDKLSGLRWFISDAFCAGRWNCDCTQEQIDAAEGACWDFADKIIAACPIEVEALTGRSVTSALPEKTKAL